MAFPIVCPPDAAITDITKDSCPENLGQIQKIVVGRRTDTVRFTDETSAGLLATWTPLLTAVDDTKVQTTPFIVSPVTNAPNAITIGGNDNETLNGFAKVVGEEFVSFTARIVDTSHVSIQELRTLIQETLVDDSLEVFFVNNRGSLIGSQPGGAGTEFKGFPISSLYVGPASIGGLNSEDVSNLSFNMDGSWRDYLTILTSADLDFDPKTDLD